MIQVVNLQEKLSKITDHWHPRIAGELNDSYVKIVKVQGEFSWHHHDNEDELFLVIEGTLVIKLQDGDLTIHPGEFVIIPHGVEHCPVAEHEVKMILLEPKTTLNTGNVRQTAAWNERTVEAEWI